MLRGSDVRHRIDEALRTTIGWRSKADNTGLKAWVEEAIVGKLEQHQQEDGYSPKALERKRSGNRGNSGITYFRGWAAFRNALSPTSAIRARMATGTAPTSRIAGS